jgi:hypothetical protein
MPSHFLLYALGTAALVIALFCRGGRSNCLFYVLKRCWQDGGYFIIRKSNHGWWPHFIWSGDLTSFAEFIPPPEHNFRWLPKWLPPPLFSGAARIFIARDR